MTERRRVLPRIRKAQLASRLQVNLSLPAGFTCRGDARLTKKRKSKNENDVPDNFSKYPPKVPPRELCAHRRFRRSARRVAAARGANRR